MSPARLIATCAAMAGLGVALTALTPSAAVLRAVVTGPQRLADTAGPDIVVLGAAALLAWLIWAWGALGLLLTVVGAVPGWVGTGARLLLRVVLPASARRTATVLLGMSLGVGGPLAGLAVAAPATGVSAVPDWPSAGSSAPPAVPRAAPPAAVPDRPAGSAHVVVPGDCLWVIAADSLRTSGSHPSDGEIATAVRGWWAANTAVVGTDPDLLRPGQVLHPPQETR